MGAQKGAIGKAVGMVWKQGSVSSRPSAELERLPGTCGASLSSQAGACEEAAKSKVVVLGSPQQIYQHRQARLDSTSDVCSKLGTRMFELLHLLNACSDLK